MSILSFTTHIVSGSHVVPAMLRAVILKGQGVLRAAWSRASVVVRLLGATRATVAGTITSLLSKNSGYQMASELVRSAIRSGSRRLHSLIRTGTRTLGRLLDMAVAPLGLVSKKSARSVRRSVSSVATALGQATTTVGRLLTSVGDNVWEISRTALVRTATTTAAAAAPALAMVDRVTGMSASVQKWLPRPIRTLIQFSSRMSGLVTVAVAAAAAMLVGLVKSRFVAKAPKPRGRGIGEPDGTAQLGEAADTQPAGAGVEGARSPSGVEAPMVPATGQSHSGSAAEQDLDWDAIAASTYVEITPKGALLVHGIPETVPEDLIDTVAQIASDAALSQLRRTIRSRPTPSRDDRRLFTKVAKEALRSRARASSGIGLKQVA